MSPHLRRTTGLLFAALLASSCAGRSLPDEIDARAPSSVEAEEAPLTPVTLAIEEDPPLPGEGGARWRGLDAARTSTTSEHQHGGHHGH